MLLIEDTSKLSFAFPLHAWALLFERGGAREVLYSLYLSLSGHGHVAHKPGHDSAESVLSTANGCRCLGCYAWDNYDFGFNYFGYSWGPIFQSKHLLCQRVMKWARPMLAVAAMGLDLHLGFTMFAGKWHTHNACWEEVEFKTAYTHSLAHTHHHPEGRTLNSMCHH